MSKAYVYKTTNLVNGKMYIGKHRSDSFDPNYYGSGFLLWRSIRKYGIENFKVEVIKYFDSEDEAYTYEYELIEKLNAVTNPNYYNMVPGGKGHIEETSNTRDSRWMNNGESQVRVQPDKIDEYLSNGYNYGSLNRHLHGRIHITDGTNEKCVTSMDLPKYLEEGWRLGRHDGWTPGIKGFISVEKDGVKTRISPDKLDSYLNDGWVRCTLSTPPNHRGNVCIHRGSEIKLVSKADAENILDSSEDWEIGKPPTTKGRKWVHKINSNGELIRSMVSIEDYSKYLEDGWSPGSAIKMKGIPRSHGYHSIVYKDGKSKYIEKSKLDWYLSNGWITKTS